MTCPKCGHPIHAPCDACDGAAPTMADPTQPPSMTELKACIWKRDEEWVLELSGEINDCAFVSRHTEPLTTPLEDVAGLPSLYSARATLPDGMTDAMVEAGREAWRGFTEQDPIPDAVVSAIIEAAMRTAAPAQGDAVELVAAAIRAILVGADPVNGLDARCEQLAKAAIAAMPSADQGVVERALRESRAIVAASKDFMCEEDVQGTLAYIDTALSLLSEGRP